MFDEAGLVIGICLPGQAKLAGKKVKELEKLAKSEMCGAKGTLAPLARSLARSFPRSLARSLLPSPSLSSSLSLSLSRSLVLSLAFSLSCPRALALARTLSLQTRHW